MGSISGSSVANVVTTGVITIPLMKRAGFPPRFAAGVEAAASTGGQMMPPIMGAGVFIMSTYTQIPYLSIVAVSFLPAIMYFLSVAFWVRIEALKRGILPIPDDTPSLLAVLRSGGHLLLPLVVLIALLIVGFTPTYAAGISIAAAVAASWLGKTPMGPRAILEALELGARNMVSTGLLLVAVGLVVNVIATTGIGNTVSLMISNWAGGSLLLTLILVALASLVLGMGLPVTASYVVLATLSAPALYTLIGESHLVQTIAAGTLPEEAKAIFMLVAPDALASLGQPMPAADAAALLAKVPADFTSQLLQQALSPALLTTALLSAHMIIFWLSQDSNVTPPVCLAAFAAAAIAGTRADGHGPRRLADRQGPLHHPAAVRLHRLPRGRLLAELVDLRLRLGRHLRADRGDRRPPRDPHLLARARAARRHRHGAALAHRPARQRPGLPALRRPVRLQPLARAQATAQPIP